MRNIIVKKYPHGRYRYRLNFVGAYVSSYYIHGLSYTRRNTIPTKIHDMRKGLKDCSGATRIIYDKNDRVIGIYLEDKSDVLQIVLQYKDLLSNTYRYVLKSEKDDSQLP